MSQNLEILINLQDIDLKLIDYDKQIAAVLGAIEREKQQQLDSQQEFNQLKDKQEDIKKQHRKLERNLDVKDAEIKKYKNQLISVKTNREYQSLLHEIQQAQETINQEEEEILNLMEAEDNLRKELKSHKDKLALEKKEIELQIKKQQLILGEHNKNKQNLQAKQDDLKKKLDADLLKQYQNLVEKKAGTAIVEVKDAVCQGCFIHITPQVYEEVKKRKKIYSCSNCQRIIYTKRHNIVVKTT